MPFVRILIYHVDVEVLAMIGTIFLSQGETSGVIQSRIGVLNV